LIDFLLNYKFTVSGIVDFFKLIIIIFIGPFYILYFTVHFINIIFKAWVESKNFSNPEKIIYIFGISAALLAYILWWWFILFLFKKV
jgi:hypothetical protein